MCICSTVLEVEKEIYIIKSVNVDKLHLERVETHLFYWASL